MEYHPFPARLTAGYNHTCVMGQGRLVPGQNAVEFTGDFIPLMPLNTAAKIEWLLGETTLADFTGRVYLSSPQLLRLVEVDPAVLAAHRPVFAVNTQLAAGLRFAQKDGAPTAGEVLYLSQKAITLCSTLPAAEGDALLLDVEVDFLTLDALPLVVQRRVPLRRMETLLLCSVPRPDDANFIALSAYAARLEQLENAST